MTYTLEQLSAFEDIRTLKHRYFRGIDTADMALLADLFEGDIAAADAWNFRSVAAVLSNVVMACPCDATIRRG